MSGRLSLDIRRIFLFQVLTAGISFATLVIVARALGPTGKASLDVALAVALIVARAGSFGLGAGNAYHVGKGTVSPAHGLGNVWLTFFACALVAAAVVASDIANAAGEVSRVPAESIAAGLALGAAYVFSEGWQGLMAALNRMPAVYAVKLLSAAARFGTIFALYIFGVGTLGILVAYVLTCGLEIALGAGYVHVAVGVRPAFRIPALVQVLSYGWVLSLGHLANRVNSALPLFVLAAAVDREAVGIFALAFQIATLVWLVDMVVIDATIYRMTSSSRHEAARLSARMARTVVIVHTAVGLLIGLGSLLVPIVFGVGFAASLLPLLILLPGVILWSVGRCFSQYFVYQVGRPLTPTAIAATALGLNAIGTLVLGPAYGAVGAAIAASLSFAAGGALSVWMMHRAEGMLLRSLLCPSLEDLRALTRMAGDRLFKA